MDTLFTKKVEPFVQIKTKTRLKMTPSAYYLYSYFLEKPDSWVFHKSKTIKESGLKEKSYYKALKELISLGYVTRQQTRKKGTFSSTVFTIYDKPIRCKKNALDDNHRVPKNGMPSQGTLNNMVFYSQEEKTQKDKKKSQSDNCKTPSGFTSGNSNKGDNMPTLDEMITKSKNKTKESKEIIAEKKKVRSPVFEKPKNNALILEKYLYDKLTPEQLSCLYYRTDKDPYMFEASCKKVGITSLEDQKYILDYCYDNWERVRRCVAFYIDIDDIPNLFYLSHFFFLIGLYTHGFGMKFGIQRFKKETSIEKNN